jgi:hypothetical protein
MSPLTRSPGQVVGCVQDGVNEARVALVEIVFAQRQDPLSAADTGGDDPGFPQDLLVMGERGPADRQASMSPRLTRPARYVDSYQPLIDIEYD